MPSELVIALEDEGGYTAEGDRKAMAARELAAAVLDVPLRPRRGFEETRCTSCCLAMSGRPAARSGQPFRPGRMRANGSGVGRV